MGKEEAWHDLIPDLVWLSVFLRDRRRYHEVGYTQLNFGNNFLVRSVSFLLRFFCFGRGEGSYFWFIFFVICSM